MEPEILWDKTPANEPDRLTNTFVNARRSDKSATKRFKGTKLVGTRLA